MSGTSAEPVSSFHDARQVQGCLRFHRNNGAIGLALPGARWHFQHGPIDLIIGLDGEVAVVEHAIDAIWQHFAGMLEALVAELPLLKRPVQEARAVQGDTARAMVAACLPHSAEFITPMAAVAGAVADTLIGRIEGIAGIRRSYINNGGDIALYLTPGTQYTVGLFSDLGRLTRGERPRLDGDMQIGYASPIRGVATSGWRGRSFSLGIADSVTVLAASSAQADAAATMIGNAVDIDDPVVRRCPANALKDDTDLGGRLVTVAVGGLTPRAIETALAAGMKYAQALRDAGQIIAAVLCLQGQMRIVAAEAEI
ncbi:MAG TPA: UPF0280 family protein [Burkholderiales bacterium]|nr:UPF0280 family protein [Burkholderiales bacterium]